MKINLRQLIITLPVVAGLSFLSSLATASSNSSSDLKIAVIDLKKIEEAKAIKSINEQVNKKREGYKKEATNKEKELKKKYGELESNKRKLSKEAFEEEENRLAKEVESFQRKSYEDTLKIEKASSEAIAQVRKTLEDIVQSRAKKEQYSLVLFKMNLIYSADSLDITDNILAELDKTLPKVDVKFSK